MAIVNVATEEAYNLVDLKAMKKYLISVKNNSKAGMNPSLFSYQSNEEMAKVDLNDPSKYVGTLPGSISIH